MDHGFFALNPALPARVPGAAQRTSEPAPHIEAWRCRRSAFRIRRRRAFEVAINYSSRQVVGVSYRPCIRRAKLKFKKAAIDYIRMTSSNHPRYVCTVLSSARPDLRDFGCFVVQSMATTYRTVWHGRKHARAAVHTHPLQCSRVARPPRCQLG